MPATREALSILMFLIPGFISDRLMGLMVARGKRDQAELVLGTLVWSLVNYMLLSPLLLWTGERRLPPWQQILIWAVVLLGAPVLEAILIAKLLGPERLNKILTALGFPLKFAPTSWDHVFARRQPYLVRITLTDGSRIGGLYDANSYASAHPYAEDLYLEQLWTLGEQGEFLDPVPLSAGALLKRSDIRYMEFFEIKEASDDDADQRAG